MSPSCGVALSTVFVVTRSALRFTVSIAVSDKASVSLLFTVAVFVIDVTEIFASTVTLYSTVKVSPGFNVILSAAVTMFTGAFAEFVTMFRVKYAMVKVAFVTLLSTPLSS